MSQIVASGSIRAEETPIRAVNRGWLEETGFAHNVSCAWGLPPLIRAGRIFHDRDEVSSLAHYDKLVGRADGHFRLHVEGWKLFGER